jgi:hypothetical protein
VPPRPEGLEIVLALNKRIYESISLTAWIADNPPALLTAISACPRACLPAFRSRKGQCVDAGALLNHRRVWRQQLPLRGLVFDHYDMRAALHPV